MKEQKQKYKTLTEKDVSILTGFEGYVSSGDVVDALRKASVEELAYAFYVLSMKKSVFLPYVFSLYKDAFIDMMLILLRDEVLSTLTAGIGDIKEDIVLRCRVNGKFYGVSQKYIRLSRSMNDIQLLKEVDADLVRLELDVLEKVETLSMFDCWRFFKYWVEFAKDWNIKSYWAGDKYAEITEQVLKLIDSSGVEGIIALDALIDKAHNTGKLKDRISDYWTWFNDFLERKANSKNIYELLYFVPSSLRFHVLGGGLLRIK